MASGRGQARAVTCRPVPLHVNTAVGSTGTTVYSECFTWFSHSSLYGAFRVLEQPQQNEVHCGASTCAVRRFMSRIASTVVGFLQQVAARNGDESTVAWEGLREFTSGLRRRCRK